jgi:hypothetical protein
LVKLVVVLVEVIDVMPEDSVLSTSEGVSVAAGLSAACSVANGTSNREVRREWMHL